MNLRIIFRLLLLTTLMLAASVAALASTVIVVDTSPQASSFLPQALVEARDLLGHVPEGERVTIVRTAPTSRAVFDSKLDAQTRLNLGVALANLRTAKVSGDLGAALAMAASLTAREGEPKRIILLTSAQPQPPQRSAFYGKSLGEILTDKNVLPDGIDVVVVRVYGSVGLSVKRPNVRVVNAAPQWEKDMQAHTTPLTAPTPAATNVTAQQRFGTWVFAGAVLLVAFLAIVGFARRQQRAKALLRREAEEEAQLLSRSVPVEEEAQPVHEERLAFNIDTGEESICLTEGRKVLVGDRWDADSHFDANGASARLSAYKDGLLIENVGTGAVRVGTFNLSSGLSKSLPPKYFELTVGRRIVSVMPEILEAEEEDPSPNAKGSILVRPISLSLEHEETRK